MSNFSPYCTGQLIAYTCWNINLVRVSKRSPSTWGKLCDELLCRRWNILHFYHFSTLIRSGSWNIFMENKELFIPCGSWLCYCWPWKLKYLDLFLQTACPEYQNGQLTVLYLWHDMTRIWVDIGPDNGLFSHTTNTLPDKADRWIPLTKASDADIWCLLWSAPDPTVKQTIETPVIWDAIAHIMTSL